MRIIGLFLLDSSQDLLGNAGVNAGPTSFQM
jgi:hypothetical protein